MLFWKKKDVVAQRVSQVQSEWGVSKLTPTSFLFNKSLQFQFN